MQTIPKDQANPSHIMIHRHLQQRYQEHQHKFAKHRAKGPVFARALDELEQALFGKKTE